MMSGFHAFYSIGGFVGAGCLPGLLSLGTPLWLAALVSVATLLLVAALAAPHWRPQRILHEGPLLALPQRVVLFIGVLAFIAFLGEGALMEWSAVFLSDVRRVDASLAGIGYVTFTLTMTVARLFGDALVARVAACWC
ncbi:hypothetical protein G6F24_016114 [Rhizopus arrhizus]|nr:hypothetical protein G6F24_016114 [Rhizopus arrhizus]